MRLIIAGVCLVFLFFGIYGYPKIELKQRLFGFMEKNFLGIFVVAVYSAPVGVIALLGFADRAFEAWCMFLCFSTFIALMVWGISDDLRDNLK